MITNYIKDWLTIIEQMSNDNTYKLSWGRAIVECVEFDKYKVENDKCIIEFNDISKCMIKYYWNQMFFFNLKQSPYADRNPIICMDAKRLIDKYKEISKNSIPVWFDVGLSIINYNDDKIYENTVKHVSKTLHENVAWRFKKVNEGNKDVYEYTRGISNIKLSGSQISELKEYGIIISKLLNYKWAQLLEKFNFTPKITNKVNGISLNRLKRNNLSKYRDELLKEFENTKAVDFYTGEELDKNDISIDHVIPWSFMYSDDIWNLVITSKSNNSIKSNSIPDEDIIEKLKERNNRMLNSLDGKFKEDINIAIKNNYVDRFYYECKL